MNVIPEIYLTMAMNSMILQAGEREGRREEGREGGREGGGGGRERIRFADL